MDRHEQQPSSDAVGMPPITIVLATNHCLLACAAAASREADLAHDGRELLRHGADTEQAAERLGVTRNHLQQALLRHPDTLKEGA